MKQQLLDQFKTKIRKASGKLSTIDLARLSSSYKKEYINVVREEEDNALQLIEEQLKKVKWKGDRMMSLRIKLDKPIQVFKEANDQLRQTCDKKLVED